MPAYPYVMSPEKIGPLFKKIGEIGVPSKFSNQTLKSLGFTSSNDARLANLVRFLSLTDQSGTPSPLWKQLRTDSRTAIAKAVRGAYSDLFQQFPDANRRDDEALRTYFSANSSLGANAVTKMVSTFKAVCALGDFSNVSDGLTNEEAGADIEETSSRRRGFNQTRESRVSSVADGMTVNINIQLQLPADATSDTYDRFFEAMRKHILTPV